LASDHIAGGQNHVRLQFNDCRDSRINTCMVTGRTITAVQIRDYRNRLAPGLAGQTAEQDRGDAEPEANVSFHFA
jgi:hypothetical protein